MPNLYIILVLWTATTFPFVQDMPSCRGNALWPFAGLKTYFNLLWQIKDALRNDPRYRSVKHEDREALFNEYISELKAADGQLDRVGKERNNEEVRETGFPFFYFLLFVCPLVVIHTLLIYFNT